jgi:chemotaxis protein methyltransferase CheR
MDSSTFRKLCDIAYERAGISLGPSKEALVAARLSKRLRLLGLASERDYLERLETDSNGDEIVQFLDAISTNHTAFFREPDHFDLLRKVVGDWQQDGLRRLRIWSAASSSGEEPYTIAIVLDQLLQGSDVDWRILATDISTRVLARAQAGKFAAERLTTLTPEQRRRFFEKGDNPDEYVVERGIRERMTFRRLNLANTPYPMRGPFDVVFCRNVMIYFDQVMRQKVIGAVEPLVRPGGYFIIGHAEALSGVSMSLQMLRPSVFIRPEM